MAAIDLQNVKAIALDMYGVVVTSTGDDFVPYVQQFFPEKTKKEIYDPWLEAEIGLISDLDVWRKDGFTGDLEAVQRGYLDTIGITEGLFEFLEKASKKYKVTLISNDVAGWNKYLRDKFGLDEKFDGISVSGDLGFKKPDERIFRHSLDQIGVPAENCIYVDDRKKNLVGAEAIGMTPVMMNARGEEYDGIVVNDFADLTKLLELE